MNETTRITKSIRQILNFSKPVILTKEKCNINELIEGILSTSQYIVNDRKKEIKFINILEKNLKEIYIDKDQIREVLNNIINNAVQAIKEKGIIKVQTTKVNESNKDYIVIMIEDSGSGIKKEDMKNIFVPFFSTKEFGKGTGLGLAFSERVVREHNGFIKTKSEIGRGTTFLIYLPQ